MAAPDLLARIRRLRRRSARDGSGLHYAEGVRAVIQALASSIPVERLVYSEILCRNAAAQKQVRLSKRAGTNVFRVTPEEFRSVSTTVRASGIGAILRQHWTPLERADPREGLCWIAVSRLRSPGNLGTIVRTAEAVGAAGIIFLGDATDPFDPAVVRASMGGLFGLHLVQTTIHGFAGWAKEHGCNVIGTSPTSSSTYTDVPVAPPVVVMLGEERKGLTDEELAVCTDLARIPIAGPADSLNVGVAAGVMLYEVLRRKPHGA